MILRLFPAMIFSLLALSCAHESVQEEIPPVQAAAPEAAPKPVQKQKIKYVYVETPPTVSAMTAPYEPVEQPTRTIASEVVRIFWPLLTMLATGALLIAGLFIEHKVLNRQLALRAEQRASLRSPLPG